MLIEARIGESLEVSAFGSLDGIEYEPDFLNEFAKSKTIPETILILGGTRKIVTNPLPESDFELSQIAIWVMNEFAKSKTIPETILILGGTRKIVTNPLPESDFELSQIAIWVMNEFAKLFGVKLTVDTLKDVDDIGSEDDLPEDAVY